jgi:hypothetical protein
MQRPGLMQRQIAAAIFRSYGWVVGVSSVGPRPIAEHPRDFVAGEGRKWRAIAPENAASRHGFADPPSRNAAIFEQLARVGSAIGWKRSQQCSRGEGAPGVGAKGFADCAAGLEPEHGFFIDLNLNSGRIGEFV